MPVKTWDTKADFDGAYQLIVNRDGIRPDLGETLEYGNYERPLIGPGTPNDTVTPVWDAILAHFSWPTTTSILIVGAGFGWSMEYLISLGYSDVYAQDTSAWIQAEKGNVNPRDGQPNSTAPGRIHGNGLNNAGQRRQLVRETLDREYDVIVSERVMSSLSDAEAAQASGWVHENDILQPGGVVVHIEVDSTGAGDPGYNWHTLDDWKALIPADVWVSSNGARILD